MTESTSNLELPYLMPSQAQKHVTHNEALSVLDAIVQLSVRDRDLTVPAGTEDEGARYIVADGATGAWAGWDGAIAARIDGAWRRIEPRTGWIAWVEDEARFVSRADEEWQAFGEGTLQQLELLGIGTAADGENPFSAKLNKVLWSARYAAEGGDGDLRYTMNKEGPAAVLSLLMQCDWSGRAEIGLIGDNDLLVKVSADGAAWKEALRIDGSSGATTFPHTPALAALAGLSGANGAFARFTGSNSATMQAIVGTVSQSGGVPTGAIVEGGSNANGTYVRYADGTQICIGTMSEQDVAVTYSTGLYYNGIPSEGTFPAAFSAVPQILAQAVRAGTASPDIGRLTGSFVTGTSTTTTGGVRSISHAITHRVSHKYIAIGRWF